MSNGLAVIIRLFRIIACLCLAAGLGSAALAQSPAPAKPPAKLKVYYSCDNLKLIVYYDNVKKQAAFVYASKHFVLPQVMSADGARYMNKSLQWWSKGTGATLMSVTNGEADSTLANCTVAKK
jgi:membrane-bound inhibitor of C-type lysozyme